jgi:hypothetical protein
LKVIAVCGTQFVYYSPGLWHWCSAPCSHKTTNNWNEYVGNIFWPPSPFFWGGGAYDDARKLMTSIEHIQENHKFEHCISNQFTKNITVFQCCISMCYSKLIKELSKNKNL